MIVVPPLLITRVLYIYEFENRTFFSVVGSKEVSTREVIESLKDWIALKERELEAVKPIPGEVLP